MASCLECITKFQQFLLLVINVFVALLGLSVMIVGAWATAAGREYFTITDDESSYTKVTVLLIVVGIFVLIIGVVGAVGALFASKVFGRIILIIYAIGLGLLIVCEIAGGIAAAVARGKLESVFRDSANSTFQNYLSDDSERDTWNQFQKDFECCGVESYKDYRQLFTEGNITNMTVPVSCCNPEVKNVTSGETVDCAMAVEDVVDNKKKYIYSKGCVDTIVDGIGSNLGAIAGAAIVLALVQIIGIVMACFVAICRKDKTYEVV